MYFVGDSRMSDLFFKQLIQVLGDVNIKKFEQKYFNS